MNREKSKEVETEDIWFKEHEEELIEKAKERKRKEEEEILRKTHYMHCPKCGHMLHEFQLEGITLDKCEKCEGIWLDKGELDELLKHSEEKRTTFFKKLFSIKR